MRTNKERAQSYAKALSIEVTEEHLGHDGPAVEVWSYTGHLSEYNSQCHSYFATGKSWAAAWGDALDYMRQLETCPHGCTCYNTNDQH